MKKKNCLQPPVYMSFGYGYILIFKTTFSYFNPERQEHLYMKQGTLLNMITRNTDFHRLNGLTRILLLNILDNLCESVFLRS